MIFFFNASFPKRYICPAITLPQSVGIVDKVPGAKMRKNCTYIAKVLQKLANGEKFEVQEPHLMPMNDFVDRNKEQLFSYLREICIDPNEKREFSRERFRGGGGGRRRKGERDEKSFNTTI